jgi:hypothetical protein
MGQVKRLKIKKMNFEGIAERFGIGFAWLRCATAGNGFSGRFAGA